MVRTRRLSRVTPAVLLLYLGATAAIQCPASADDRQIKAAVERCRSAAAATPHPLAQPPVSDTAAVKAFRQAVALRACAWAYKERALSARLRLYVRTQLHAQHKSALEGARMAFEKDVDRYRFLRLLALHAEFGQWLVTDRIGWTPYSAVAEHFEQTAGYFLRRAPGARSLLESSSQPAKKW